ncbi:EIN3-binding F-box protein 1-like [Solanum pennellii]|uniref:EIN3-binding F-box protein 1-like n=1 Tax=Solanum pennellii TaxID=28526 RepID=A0ABM1H023_SOLPN|nr:EIN3-binding F-box protein 1-like [Solanum pennellii]
MSSENGVFFAASYPTSRQSSLFLSRRQNRNVNFPPRKRICVTTSSENFEQRNHPSIEILLDECLFKVFKHLPSGKERSVCACVSKRWLTLLSSIRKDKIPESNGIEGKGSLVRSLVGREATDVRLAAIAVGASNYKGLAKLSIGGDNPCHGVSDGGLKAIARCCPTLRDLSLSNMAFVGDEGLSEIADGCHLLEKLYLFQCPKITDNSLLDIAKNCTHMTSLTIDSCIKIGNEAPKAVGKYCPKLKVVILKNCPLIGDRGIEDLFMSAGNILTEVELQALHISDISIKIISQHGTALTSLDFGELRRVVVRDFWVMGIGQCLHKLKSLSISACSGVNDLGLHVICKACPNLKLFCVRKSFVLSDNGLVACVKALVSLQHLRLEECHLITQAGFFGILLNCGKKLKTFSLVKCFGVNDLTNAIPSKAPCCNSLVSLTIRNCPGVGNATIAIISRLCHRLTHIKLIGLLSITDEGLFPLVKNCAANLVAVNLSGCVNITDISVSYIVNKSGRSLKYLLVDGCKNVTDATLVEIWNSCWTLNVLDVSKCGITDSGITTLSSAIQLQLQILSLSGCPLVSDNSLPFLLDLAQNLQGLNIQHCPNISSKTVDALVEMNPRCDILS